MTITFAELGLKAELLRALEELKFTAPTPIQAQVTPLLLEGHDVVGQAQTGTGKTAAFALPILNKITHSYDAVQALVVTPTRELANQVTKSFEEFAKFSDTSVLAVYGGQPYGPQKHKLRKGVDVVVGTPGRLLDLLKRGDLDLSHAHSVALDEADEMLSMGFIDDIEKILSKMSDDRQTLLFSATMPKPIRRLADRYMTDPQSVTIERKTLTADNIKHRHYLVNEKDRRAATIRLLETEDTARVIIFGQTRARTSDLANTLNNHGFSAEVLNGDLSQEAREKVLGRFRNDQTKILVATDVAARGLDVDGVSHVFNFDVPQEVESYVHRIGRTGRAGKDGVAISLITHRERHRISKIEQRGKIKVSRETLPTLEDIKTKRDERLELKLREKLTANGTEVELKIVQQLIREGHDPVAVAAAGLSLGRTENETRKVPKISEVSDRGGRSDSPGGRGRKSQSRGYKPKRSGGYAGNRKRSSSDGRPKPGGAGGGGATSNGSKSNANANGGKPPKRSTNTKPKAGADSRPGNQARKRRHRKGS